LVESHLYQVSAYPISTSSTVTSVSSLPSSLRVNVLASTARASALSQRTNLPAPIPIEAASSTSA